MAVDDNNPLSLHYRCSVCHEERDSHFRVSQHTKLNKSCKDAGAVVESKQGPFTDGLTVQPKRVSAPVQDMPEAATIEIIEEEDEPLSMAEQAAVLPLPVTSPFASNWVTAPDLDEDEEPQPESFAPALEPRFGAASNLQVNPEPWLILAWQSDLREGYLGTISQWVHEMVEYVYVLLGQKIEVLAVSEPERELALAGAGLKDG